MNVSPKKTPVSYTICPANPAAHHFIVTLRCVLNDPQGQRFALPAWIPGSYLIRDFARNVLAINARTEGKQSKDITLHKIDKHTWQAPPLKLGTVLTLCYTVYAWELSVRHAHLDQNHAFFNGSSVFLRVLGQEDAPCFLDILPPKDKSAQDWQVASALTLASGEKNAAKRYGFGLYRAENYDELIDHPVEMGRFTRLSFTACGIPHDIIISGQHDTDTARLCADVRKICTWQIRFFGEPAPMSRYVFLLTVTEKGHGGLEHRASTALLAPRHQLPYRGMTAMSEGYRDLLGLISHEYFHTWNVKALKPREFIPYDLNRENTSELLWFFEGFTSYYDDLTLCRAGLISPQEWLNLLAKNITALQRTPGRLRQSLAESSFDAWIKYYRPDENTPNAVVSYYLKGSLFALALDLKLRHASTGKASLDHLMQALWQDATLRTQGVSEDSIRQHAEQLAGLNLQRFFAQGLHSTVDLPLKALLAHFGVRLRWTAESASPTLGIKTKNDHGELKVATVYDGSAAQAAGLAADDSLLAFNGLRITPSNLPQMLARHHAGDSVLLHAFRGDELRKFTVSLAAAPKDLVSLTLSTKLPPLAASWLSGKL